MINITTVPDLLPLSTEALEAFTGARDALADAEKSLEAVRREIILARAELDNPKSQKAPAEILKAIRAAEAQKADLDDALIPVLKMRAETARKALVLATGDTHRARFAYARAMRRRAAEMQAAAVKMVAEADEMRAAASPIIREAFWAGMPNSLADGQDPGALEPVRMSPSEEDAIWIREAQDAV